MNKLFALEAIPTGGRLGTIRSLDRLLTFTLRNVFPSRPVSNPDQGEEAGLFRISERKPPGRQLLALALLLMVVGRVPASTVLSTWTPIFDGIDHAVGTNIPDGTTMPDLMVMNALRVDLANPNIQLFATPPIATNYSADFVETVGYTTTNFLKSYGLQVAVNANAFATPGSGDPGGISGVEPEGTPFNVIGLEISQGTVVSPQVSTHNMASFLFTSNNEAAFIPTNWPGQSPDGVYTAVTGFYAILVNGVNVGYDYLGSSDAFHNPNPRTAFGLSEDRRYLYLIVIDGGNWNYSWGALDWETAAWLTLVGASDGANMDGGGSTCMAMQGPDGVPMPLNQDSAALQRGVERTDGSHFGVLANPVPAPIPVANSMNMIHGRPGRGKLATD